MTDYFSQKSNISFSGRPNYKKTLPKVKTAIKRTFPYIESPSGFRPKTRAEYNVYFEMIDNLSNIRSILDKNSANKDIKEYFRSLLGLTKSFRVANCGEMAEIAKIALKLNGIKNCDIFCLYAKKVNSSSPPRYIDHVITVINAPHVKSAKKYDRFIEPSRNTKIIDLWLNDNIKKINGIRNKSVFLKIEPDEKILMKPIDTLEPDKETLAVLKKEFPSLLIKKRNRNKH